MFGAEGARLLVGRGPATEVRYELKPDEDGTRIVFEHSGFDVSQPWGTQALKGAEFGWNKMLDALKSFVSRRGSER